VSVDDPIGAGACQAALRDLQERLAADPEALDLRLELAALLAAVGRTSEARDAYLEILARDPAHRLALNRLGTLLFGTGYRTAARTAYAEAVARHPSDPLSRVNFGNVLHDAGEFAAAREHFEAALRFEPGNQEAHQGLAYVLAELGDPEGARWHRQKGFENRAVTALPYRGSGQPVPLLLLISAIGGNIPTRTLLDDRVFQTFAVAPEFYDRKDPLPPHRVVFNAIGDADLDAPALAAAESLLALTTARVINRPSAVRATGRADHARLRGVPGVIIPSTMTLPREVLCAPDALDALARHGFHFPLLIRTPGFQTGRHFVRVETPDVLPAALSTLPGSKLTVIEFLDARSPDGNVRKYRVMMIGGGLYPLHLAISTNWKVHYFTADMADRADHRAEDADFLADMPRVLGPRIMEALAQIQSILALDYAGIDFGLSAAGDLLFFEANATMVVNPPDPDPRWSYRRPAVDRIFAAVRAMLIQMA
jgi:tetratricopeptide (TPR) repeat protein